jgi:predicted Zn-dependent protease
MHNAAILALNTPRRLGYILSLCVFLLISTTTHAQLIQHRKNAVQRYEIDAKRTASDINSADALPRSREFKRIDSSYFVGWMYEGVYKHEHAADYLGYKNAAAPLEKALALLEKDYRKELSTRSPEVAVYIFAYRFQIDYSMIAYYLMDCYANIEEPQKVYDLMHRVLKWNFQRDYSMDAYNYLGWTVHRNRFYTGSKYGFLKNSIDDNERLANKLLDSGLRRININRSINAAIFPPGYEEADRQRVYHYKAMLYSYAIKIDSARYFYEQMRKHGLFPHNNYATFRSICGDFREAEKEYEEAIPQDGQDKRLKEWAYYTSIINIYKAEPQKGADLMRDMIKANGSTPGFGWYNIALARCLFYDGQVKEAERYADKAAAFKELHIGTTLGQTHYDFSTQLVKLLTKQAAVERQKFEHANWWYNPSVLATMTKLQSEKYLQQFLIINQFAQNPERDRVIYKLFSTESTVSWDEVWYLIKDFSTKFFLQRYKKEAETDERQYVRKYFKLFIAQLQMKMGNYSEARTILDGLLNDRTIDADYEKLFVARIYQAQAECAKERDDNAAYAAWMNKFYSFYPQLIPNTGLKMNMNLHVLGSADKEVVDRLKGCNINFTNSSGAPEAYISFTGSNDKKKISYYVMNSRGSYIVKQQSFNYKKADEAGTELAYRLFNIGSKQEEKAK